MGKIDTAVQWAVNTANDSSHGYDQTNRWGPDYDCSAFVITAWDKAGVPVKANGATYTGNMLNAFLKSGFSNVTSQINLSTGSGLQKGDVLLNTANHTVLYIGNNQVASASENEKGTTTGGKTGDQTGKEIYIRTYYNFPWTYVLRYTAEGGSTGGSDTDKPTLSYGSNGIEVKAIQKKLMLLGYDCGESGADGDFGSGTQSAVKKFQSDNGLAVDGICGANTHVKLDAKYKALGVFVAVCNLQDLKVRTGPGTNYSIFSKYPSLDKGEEVKVGRTTSNNWYFAFIGRRYVAYMAAKYMKKK